MTGARLTHRQLEVLEFARAAFAPRSAGYRIRLIRERFGVSEAAYSQQLQVVIRQPSALEYDAGLVRRLLRLSEERYRARELGRIHP